LYLIYDMEDVQLAPHIFTTFMGVPITDSLITIVFGSLLLILLVWWASSHFSIVPSKPQIILEEIVSFGRDFVIETLGNEKVGKKVYPLILTIFIFILFFNLIKFIPGFELLTFNGHHVFRAIHSDLNITVAMALVSFFIVQFLGIYLLGFIKYGSKFINFKKWTMIPIGIIELISEVSKVISLSLRLYLNILVGGILLLLLSSVSHLLLPLPMMFFEIFVAILQAAIFSILTLLYIKIAISEPH